jgi:tRNA(Ile)-lysidine synthase
MDDSRKRSRSDLAAAVRAGIGPHLSPGARLTLALSGGLDSIVLLDLLAPLAAPLDFRLDALHVHHGLSPAADAWAAHAVAAAAHHGVPCAVERVDLGPYRALGVEGAARAARYAAYARTGSDLVALAHHRDDQAETLLVQLVRGGGVAGLAGMPMARALRGGSPTILRPLLGARRAALLAHARARGLDWVEDESNADPLRTRSFIRQRIMPVLEQLRPGVVEALARSAAHAAEAAELADALAHLDAATCMRAGRLEVAPLLALPAVRARNVLRYHVAADFGAAVERAALEELLRQLRSARPDAAIAVALGAVTARRYGGELWIEPQAHPSPPSPAFRAVWTGEPCWPLPALGGCLRFEAARGEGLAAAALEAGVEVRVRAGGERLRLRLDGPRRALKDLLQEARVPPWERGRLPLVYCGGELAWAARVGADARFAASGTQPGYLLQWQPDARRSGQAAPLPL